MKLHTDSMRQARHDSSPIPPATGRRPPMHRGGRRAPGLRRLQPYRTALICRLWHTFFPRTPQRQQSDPNAVTHAPLERMLRDVLLHIARHVVRRTRRAPAGMAPRRGERRPVRPAARGGSWWQLHSPCDGMRAAARDGTGR